MQISEAYKGPKPIIFQLDYSEPNYEHHRAHGQVAGFNGSLANRKWKEQLSGASRTEAGSTYIILKKYHSAEFLTAATPGTRIDMGSCVCYR